MAAPRKSNDWRYGLYLVVLAALLYLPQQGMAQVYATLRSATSAQLHNPAAKPQDLFSEDSLLKFTLVVNYQRLLKDRGEERNYHTATLSYVDSAGTAVQVPLRVMVRGNRRRDVTVCRFPPLMLNLIRKEMPKGTVFEGQNKLKLVTHCIDDDYVLREYLVYKVYNLLAEESFRVRLCQVTYADSVGRRKEEVRFAFLIEDDKSMAKRTNMKLIPEERRIAMDYLDQKAMARLALFQYMIGNTDWSVPYRHNIDLLAPDSLSAPIPVPFDFDYAGIVGTPYAVPPPELGLASVKQRLYRAYSFPENVHRETVNIFNSFRTPIYAVYRQCEPLSKSGLRQSLSYLDGFYDIINHPRKFEREIVKVGERNEKAYVTVRGLK
ncbi:hypothetical protein [Pontibacter ramchanderi]|uniref:Uncharacterized protein n=1 Tax=Pontibacter ramchanderi TaxID=1179743 RepID=A0A2N3V442_9BACT|nr:hypothetical protein [Pontibacter ramchanderi]PKV76399.1 hypothetical protein BD749_1352 [Pontibacter ramchanderi]